MLAIAQPLETACPLMTAKNGTVVTLTGEAVHGAHDGLLRISGCSDEVLIAYADDPSLKRSKLKILKDEAYRIFRRTFDAEEAAPPGSACIGCWKYRVHADFHGRLDVSENAGMIKDPKTGKLLGFVGFGHPMPFTRYRLVVFSIAHVQVSDR
jgi:hypothetical protein